MAGGATTTVTAEFLGTENVARQMNVLGRAGAQFSSDLTSKLGKMFGAVAIGTMAFSKMEQSISKNMATAKQVSSLAIKFNVDPSQVHSMKIAADDAGVSIRSLMMASKQFGKVAGESLSNKDAAANMKQLGIDAAKLAEMQAKPMKYLPEAAVALAGIADENERAAAGAFLFGRQYQQISPLLEKLGTDEEARGKFLSNNNAMTNEQIKLNKEAARIQSEMSEGWDKFMAGAAKPLNWAMNFVSYLSNALSVQLELMANSDKMEKGKAKEDAGKRVYGVSNYTGALAMRTDITRKKIESNSEGEGFQTDEELGITKEDRMEYDKVVKAGGVEKYAAIQLQKAADISANRRRRGDHRTNSSGDDNAYVPLDKTGKMDDKEMEAEESIDQKFLSQAFGRNGHLLKELDEDTAKKALRELQIASANSSVVDGLVQTGNLTENEEGYSYKSGLSNLALDMTTDGQAQQKAASAAALQSANAAKQALARMDGNEYDTVTGREYSRDQYDELMRQRAADSKKGPGEFLEAKAAAAAKKKKKAQTRALEKSERHLNEGNLKPVEKAEAAIVDVRGDMLPIEEDILDKTEEIEKSKERLKAAEEGLVELSKKKEAGAEAAALHIAEMNKTLAKENTKLTAEEEADIRKKYDLTKEDTEKIAQLNGAIRGEGKLISQTEGERLELQTKLNGEKAKEVAMIDALRKAKEAEWAKDKARAKDLHEDDQNYEREMQELKYKNMKLSGKTQLDILKEKYNFELKRYGEASAEKDKLEAEIADKQAARVAEAFAAGDEDAYKAGEATDEETAALKAAREKKDKGRQDLEKAVYDFDQFKPQAVVSELGKMGGGAAVQFGNNPIDEIRKSNSFLKAIEKNTATGNIKSLKTFETADDKTYREMEAGLFGDDVPM